MVGRYPLLARLGIPGSAAVVLSELSRGTKTTKEMADSSGMSRSAILNGVRHWRDLGVALRCDTNMWRLDDESSYVEDMVAKLKHEEVELRESIRLLDEILG